MVHFAFSYIYILKDYQLKSLTDTELQSYTICFFAVYIINIIDDCI